MLHQAQSTAEGNPNQIAQSAEVAQRLTDAELEMVSERSGLSMDYLKAKIDGKEWWLNAKEAMGQHLVDRILDSDKEIPPVVKVEVKQDLLQLLFGGKK